jgi:5-methylcytosine-specific restriction enzyme A
MATYLLIWNPKQWHWWDDLGDSFEKRGRYWYGSWSTGRNKSIVSGDRVFLSRVGREPRGIVASGYAISDVGASRHWQAERRKVDEKALYIDVKFDALLNPARERILDRSLLEQSILGTMNWSPRVSGVEIPAPVATALERTWSRFLSKSVAPRPIAEPRAIEGLATETISYVRGRSRKLRDRALQEAGGICEACRVNFKRVLGGKGVRVLQVHHRRQFAATDAPRVTRLSDLAVLCANCHMLVHMDPDKAMPAEKLRPMLRRARVV